MMHPPAKKQGGVAKMTVFDTGLYVLSPKPGPNHRGGQPGAPEPRHAPRKASL